MTFEYACRTLDENGRKLLEMLKVWKDERGDIDFEDTPQGFNIVLMAGKRRVTLLVFWGQLNQKESFVMESRQHEYPDFVKMGRADRIKVLQTLCGAYFQRCKTNPVNMNARLEFRQVPMTEDRVGKIVAVIDEVTRLVKAKTKPGPQTSMP